jgi:hypothetical protein
MKIQTKKREKQMIDS